MSGRLQVMKMATNSLSGVPGEVPSPILRRDDSNVLIRRADNTFESLLDGCEHGCKEEGLGKYSSMRLSWAL